MIRRPTTAHAIGSATVCGGGNAAHVLVPLMAQAGWQVRVFAPFADEAQRLRAHMTTGGGTMARFAGGRSVRGQACCISADAAEVIPGAGLILLALPAYAHGPTLAAIAPYLEEGVTIVALPARSGFDLQARATLEMGALSPTVAGLQTLPWACRVTEYGREVNVLGTKARVDLAAVPGDSAAQVVDILRPLLGVNLQPITSFLALTLANTGQLIHPGIMYGRCRGREDQTYAEEEIPLFYQGLDSFTVGLLEALSDEVQAVAGALARQLLDFDPEEVTPLYDWLLAAYPEAIEDAGSLRQAFNSNRAYAGLRLPVRAVDDGRYVVDFEARYLSEDVPHGLVVVRGIAELARVPTPTIDTVIDWAQERLGRCYLDGSGLCGPDVHRSRAPQAYGVTDLVQLCPDGGAS
ncbi:MAG: NAD/NADP octopine/nopaline dehydrogenase family protein [Chloroflexota bacterium]